MTDFLNQFEEIQSGKSRTYVKWEDQKNRERAIRWLVEKVRYEGKKNWPDTNDAKRYKLSGLLASKYKGSMYKALVEVFGNENPKLIESPWEIESIRLPKSFWKSSTVDKAFDMFIEKNGRPPTTQEFSSSGYNFIYYGKYPGIKNWDEYVKYRGYEPYEHRSPNRTPSILTFSKRKFLNLYRKKFSDRKIAKEMSVSETIIIGERKRRGLKPNFPPRKPHSEEEKNRLTEKLVFLCKEKGYKVHKAAAEIGIGVGFAYRLAVKGGIEDLINKPISDEEFIDAIKKYRTF